MAEVKIERNKKSRIVLTTIVTLSIVLLITVIIAVVVVNVQSSDGNGNNPTPTKDNNKEDENKKLESLPDDTGKIHAEISNYSVSGQTLNITVYIDGRHRSGECQLTMEGPNGQTYEDKSNLILRDESSSACSGFSVNLGDLRAKDEDGNSDGTYTGTWNVKVKIVNSNDDEEEDKDKKDKDDDEDDDDEATASTKIDL